MLHLALFFQLLGLGFDYKHISDANIKRHESILYILWAIIHLNVALALHKGWHCLQCTANCAQMWMWWVMTQFHEWFAFNCNCALSFYFHNWINIFIQNGSHLWHLWQHNPFSCGRSSTPRMLLIMNHFSCTTQNNKIIIMRHKIGTRATKIVCTVFHAKFYANFTLKKKIHERMLKCYD